jgi:hypothetical protein
MQARPFIKVRTARNITLEILPWKYYLNELELGLSDHCSLAGLGLKQINQQPLLPSLHSF